MARSTVMCFREFDDIPICALLIMVGASLEEKYGSAETPPQSHPNRPQVVAIEGFQFSTRRFTLPLPYAITPNMVAPTMAQDLNSRSLAMFDRLHALGKLFYQSTESEVVEDRGFQFEFRTSPILSKKVILAHDAPERQGHGGPFLRPDPDFIVAEIGPQHILELSMHCVYRPAFVLHTREFALQTDDLDLADIIAVKSVMDDLSRAGPQMAIYNCGVEAGASQGHKHMQVFALPAPFPLFPAAAESEQVIASNIPGVPYRHYVLRLPRNSQPDRIFGCYGQLLQAMREDTRTTIVSRPGRGAYNVILTDDWLCLVPRRYARRGITGANSVGMVGILWVRDKAERDSWDKLGLTDHLRYLGVPKDQSDIHDCQSGSVSGNQLEARKSSV